MTSDNWKHHNCVFTHTLYKKELKLTSLVIGISHVCRSHHSKESIKLQTYNQII